MAAFLLGCSPAAHPGPDSVSALEFVGSEACGSCHPTELAAWRGSHHDLAFDRATEETVLGDFADATTQAGGGATFFRKDGRFYVRTRGESGTPDNFPISHVIGTEPLQQYLVPFPGGRYQALSFAWDSRPPEDGGARWFHLYPDGPTEAGDRLHWTGIDQRWNHMCADCHSTGISKGLENGQYETTWEEIDVACEACHGPGEAHIDWAKTGGPGTGLAVNFPPASTWSVDPATDRPVRDQPLTSQREVETCARCHSRRSLLGDRAHIAGDLLDSYRPHLLDESSYHADGQVDGEVYVYGSFLQSKMHGAGVACSDCHDPHSLELRAPPERLCVSCHPANVFDSPDHHFHAEGPDSPDCVACHMPTKNFMTIDTRHDHSFRVPRPDLSVRHGTPNTCNGCHSGLSNEWAAETVRAWYGNTREPHHGETLAAAQDRDPGSGPKLVTLATDESAPTIARASALSLLRGEHPADAAPALALALADPEPLVRLGALAGLQALDPETRWAMASAQLADPLRAVRIEAARILAKAAASIPDRLAGPFAAASREVLKAESANADRPEAQFNLALFHQDLGRWEDAQTHYERAIEMDPHLVAASLNLADLHRGQGREEDATTVLRTALATTPDVADLHHSLGLAWVRQERMDAALTALGRATDLRPDHSRYHLVYATALKSVGNTDEAIAHLERATDRLPQDRELAMLLVAHLLDAKRLTQAGEYVRTLRTRFPDDRELARWAASLETHTP